MEKEREEKGEMEENGKGGRGRKEEGNGRDGKEADTPSFWTKVTPLSSSSFIDTAASETGVLSHYMTMCRRRPMMKDSAYSLQCARCLSVLHVNQVQTFASLGCSGYRNNVNSY